MCYSRAMPPEKRHLTFNEWIDIAILLAGGTWLFSAMGDVGDGRDVSALDWLAGGMIFVVGAFLVYRANKRRLSGPR